MTARPKPHIHGRDHEHGGADPARIHYEDVGTSGGGSGGGTSGIFFDTDPQEGDWLHIHTTSEAVDPADPEASLTSISLIADEMIDIAGGGGVRIFTTGSSGIRLIADPSGYVAIELGPNQELDISGLPTSISVGGNRVWRDSSGYLRIGP